MRRTVSTASALRVFTLLSLALSVFLLPGCGPDKAVHSYNLGLEAAKRQDYPEAVRLWNESLALRPDDAETQYNIGAALVELKRYAEAEAHLRRATELAPNDPDAFQMLGRSLEKQGKLPEAKNAYSFALSLKRTNVPALVGLASIALEEGQNKTAEDFAIRAAELDPGNLQVNLLLSEAYFRNGDFNSAYGQILTARKLGPADASTYFLTGKIAYHRRMYADALDALRSARALGASNDDLFRYLGLTNLALGDTGEAEKEFRLAIYKNKENAGAWRGLAETYIKNKRWREAGEAVDEALRIDPSNTDSLLDKALVAMGEGDASGAVRTLESVRARSGYPPITDYYLGNAYLRTGDEARAREALARFVDTWAGDPALANEARSIMERLSP